MHKGFKCLDISTGRIYISRDVLFDKSVFPFASLHSPAGTRYHSDILLLPATAPGDDSFSNATNVHTLPVLPTAICFQVQPELPNPENVVNFQADFPAPSIAMTRATFQAPSSDLIGGVGCLLAQLLSRVH
jgi:hypothetical protein